MRYITNLKLIEMTSEQATCLLEHLNAVLALATDETIPESQRLIHIENYAKLFKMAAQRQQ